MNHLAHLFLSCDCEDHLLGNFMTDYLRLHEIPHLPKGLQEGVQLHRLIDSYTDAHPEVQQVKALLRPLHRKYAPVIADIYFDYLLAQNWSRFTQESLRDFSRRMYGILKSRKRDLPSILQQRLPNMIADDWLMGYATEAGMRRTFYYLRRRASRPQWIEGATDTLLLQREELEQHFLRFFPDMMAEVERVC